MLRLMSSLHIASRFCGPPHCGNGGYVAGRLATLISGAAEVTLRLPAPLDAELSLEPSAEGAHLTSLNGALIAEAKPIAFELALPRAVSFAEAEQATRGFLGFREHPYPGCFVCGTQRDASAAGLALFPGPIAGEQVVAAPFQPAPDLCDAQGTLRDEFIWAALDCPSWFGHASFATEIATILLGRLAITIVERPRSQQRCVVQGWSLGREGRRIQCGSALFAENGRCLAYARSTWIELKAA